MEKSYPKISKKLNSSIQQILSKFFASERKYYETAEDVQITELSRYLYHQSSIRNRFGNELCEAIIASHQVPEVSWIKKGKLNRSGLDEKVFLEDKNYIPLMESCFTTDEELIDMCRALFRSEKLPIEILEVLTTSCTQILFELVEGWDLVSEMNSQEINRNSRIHKVILLHPVQDKSLRQTK